MKFSLSVLLAAVSAAAFATAATAMPSGDAPSKGPGPYPMDCAKAKNKVRCETINQDIAACKDKVSDDWRECMHQPASTAKFTAPKARDCTKARNQEICEAHTKALEACKEHTTLVEHRKCMAAQSPLQAPKKD